MCAVCAIPRALNWSITILSTFHMRCYVYNTRLNIKMKNKYIKYIGILLPLPQPQPQLLLLLLLLFIEAKKNHFCTCVSHTHTNSKSYWTRHTRTNTYIIAPWLSHSHMLTFYQLNHLI